MARRAEPKLPAPLERLLTRVGGLLVFQQSYVRQLADYTTRVGDLTSSRSVDPGEWIENYALFLSRVVRDLGDWAMDRQSLRAEDLPFLFAKGRKKKREVNPRLRGAFALPVLQGKLRAKEGATGVPLHVPPAVYARLKGRDPKVTLMTDGLLLEGGGAPLSRNHVVFRPSEVFRSKPEAELKITDVAGAVKKDSTYRGFVWIKETRQVIAAVEIRVL